MMEAMAMGEKQNKEININGNNVNQKRDLDKSDTFNNREKVDENMIIDAVVKTLPEDENSNKMTGRQARKYVSDKMHRPSYHLRSDNDWIPMISNTQNKLSS